MQQQLCAKIQRLQETQYVYDDLDVDHVDDDKGGREASFFSSETAMVRVALLWEHARFHMRYPICTQDGT